MGELVAFGFPKFQSPQWGDNSKVKILGAPAAPNRFSPRNGEIILKVTNNSSHKTLVQFQSPQWGDNSKALWCSML